MQPSCTLLRNTHSFAQLGQIRPSSLFSNSPVTCGYVFFGEQDLYTWDRSRVRWNHNQANPNPHPKLSGSAKLFADAAREDDEARAQAEVDKTATATSRGQSSTSQQQQHENWTGDESVQDAVLRMLIDKYKPLRTASGVQSADQKLKRDPPKISHHGYHPPLVFEDPDHLEGKGSDLDSESDGKSSTFQKLEPTKTGSWASDPLLPSSEGHQPWHTQFKAPKHDTPAIRLAQAAPVMTSSKPTSAPALPSDERARRLEIERRKRTQQATKLADARESTLDYRLGIRNASGRMGAGAGAGVNPTSLKGWTNLIEDRIEKARKAGMFSTIQGRGKPLAHSPAEHNPFIAREEFLMNRIIQKNGAAPPWVEIQLELETAVNKFRQILHESWTRRAVRVLSDRLLTSTPSLQTIRELRDPAWIEKERSYHETAIKELNGLVRRYNGVAPYSVRRPLYTREAEVDKMYEESVDDIQKGLEERSRALGVGSLDRKGAGGGGGAGAKMNGKVADWKVLDIPPTRLFREIVKWIWDMVRRLLRVGA